jgi:hypothetical protein
MPRPRRRLAASLATLSTLALATALPAHPVLGADITVAAVTTRDGALPFVIIDGPIERGDWSRFMKVMKAHPEAQGVALNSIGGSLDDGLAIAGQIDKRGLATALIDTCHSVCSIMFLAGAERYVPPNFTLSVHSAYRQLGDYVARDELGNETVAWFLGSLGYPLALVRLWNDTAPEDAATITWAMNDKWDLGFQPIAPIATLATASYAP